MKNFMLFVLLSVVSCSPSQIQLQARTANEAVMAGNRLLPSLVSAYQAEGDIAIDDASSRNDALAAINLVRVRWRPVWGICDDEAAGPSHHCHGGAWPGLRDVQDLWASLLEQNLQGKPFDAAALADITAKVRRALCDLRAALPQGVNIPAVAAACGQN